MHSVDPMDFLSEVHAMASQETPTQAAALDAAPPPRSNGTTAPAPKGKARSRSRPASNNKARSRSRNAAATRASEGASRRKSYAVLVPADVYPSERCTENGGAGWSAMAHHHTNKVARVSFTQARDPQGHPFEDVYLRLSALQRGDPKDTVS